MGVIYCQCSQSSIFILWELWRWGNINISFPILLDRYSARFLITVTLIAGCIYVFSIGYMAAEPNFIRFHFLVFSFVVSIVLLILSPHLVRVLLGWDGLGVTSYLLVIYFQSTKSFNAGILTALTNRVGDVLILLGIALVLSFEQWNFSSLIYSYEGYPLIAMGLLVLASCTKRAQIPFSAWLPAAIAAPTPVSSLVHSSTLVTAGVYLIVRFCPLLIVSGCQAWLLWVGIGTIVLAGCAAIVENDIKKVIALSTLRQLGVMMTSVGAGFFNAAFFHLLSHAFFKALLFITVGRIIHMALDFQDLRKARLTEKSCFLRLAINLGANLRLCGLPFTRGFFSKDLCLELFFSSSLNSWLRILFIVATSLTAAYTIRFIYILIISITKLTPLSNNGNLDTPINSSILLLFPVSITAGRFIRWALFLVPATPLVRSAFKNIALLVVCVGALSSWGLLRGKYLKLYAYATLMFNMWGLPLISSRLWTERFLSRAWTFRTLMDFNWTPLATTHLTLVAPSSSLVSKKFKFRNFVLLSGGIFWIFVLGLLYLCVTSLFIYIEIKIQKYT